MIEEAEIVGEELEPYRAEIAPSNLFGVSDPVQVIEQAEKVATALKDVISKKGLFATISGKNHVLVEGWTLLGSMLGVFPVCVWTRKLEDGWEARVEARTRTGDVVGAAEAMCTHAESHWKNRDEYALRSMAQTRATSKAMRQPLGFVVTLAGYVVTPAEEMSMVEPSAVGSGLPPSPPPVISDAQHRKIGVLLKELNELQPVPDGQMSYIDQIKADFGVKSRKDLTHTEAGAVIETLLKWKKNAEFPA